MCDWWMLFFDLICCVEILFGTSSTGLVSVWMRGAVSMGVDVFSVLYFGHTSDDRGR